MINDYNEMIITERRALVDNPTVFNACILTYQPGVNSINILRTPFLYESELHSFL